MGNLTGGATCALQASPPAPRTECGRRRPQRASPVRRRWKNRMRLHFERCCARDGRTPGRWRVVRQRSSPAKARHGVRPSPAAASFAGSRALERPSAAALRALLRPRRAHSGTLARSSSANEIQIKATPPDRIGAGSWSPRNQRRACSLSSRKMRRELSSR
jgi:hypothetical protein